MFLFYLIFFFNANCNPQSQGLANCGPWAKSNLPPAFVNKILLEPSHPHLFTHYLWQLLHSKGRVVTETISPAKPKRNTPWPFPGKTLLSLALNWFQIHKWVMTSDLKNTLGSHHSDNRPFKGIAWLSSFTNKRMEKESKTLAYRQVTSGRAELAHPGPGPMALNWLGILLCFGSGLINICWSKKWYMDYMCNL